MLVVDASVAVKFVAPEPDSDKARVLIAGPDPLIAPDWLLLEVASALRGKEGRGEIGRIEAAAGLEAMPAFFEELIASRELIEGAYRLASKLDHAIYDCMYLELAIRERSLLVTADKKFVNAAARHGLASHVILLADFSA